VYNRYARAAVQKEKHVVAVEAARDGPRLPAVESVPGREFPGKLGLQHRGMLFRDRHPGSAPLRCSEL